MIQNKNINSDIFFLVLARPADGLFALVRELLAPRKISVCESVYDFMATLLMKDLNVPVLLIARPAMLAKPYLSDALRKFPNLRIIGWLGSYEQSGRGVRIRNLPIMVTVGTPGELSQVTAAMIQVLGSQSSRPTPDNTLNPAEYRLSGDELNALLGAGQ